MTTPIRTTRSAGTTSRPRRRGPLVAMVSEHASPLATLGAVDAGGQNVHVAALARTLARHGTRVRVYTRRDAPTLPDEVRLCPGVTVVHVDAGPPEPIPKDELYPLMERFGEVLHDDWARRRPDVVHAHFWMSGIAALDAAHAHDIPLVQTFHALGAVKRREQGPKDTSPPERIDVEQHLLRECDHVIATCTDEVFELLRLGGDAERISVVPCGVDLDLFRPGGPREDRVPGRDRIVVVSRLVQRKGIGNAISAMAHLPGAELIIAGGPDKADLATDAEARRLERLAVECGVADRVQLRGRLAHDAVARLLRSADVAVCVPWYEPFGIVTLEAMACGVPVVATAVGGQVDTVVDGVTGLHVAPRRPERIADAVRFMLDHPEVRAQFGAAGARRSRERYGWDRVAAMTAATYRSLVRPAAVAGRGAR